MTREEAISVLERVAHTESKWPGTEDTLEALYMAISAIRQQDVPDTDVGKKMTNADRIRAMSDEELAKLLLDGCRGSKCDDQSQNEWGSVNCFECRMKWLQQPAEEADHA